MPRGILRDVQKTLARLSATNGVAIKRSVDDVSRVVYVRFASHLRHLPAFHAEQAHFNYSL